MDEQEGQAPGRETTMVTEHLEIGVQHITRVTPTMVTELTRFIAQPVDPTGLRILTLPMMAQSLKQEYGLIDSLLEIIEKQMKGEQPNE